MAAISVLSSSPWVSTGGMAVRVPSASLVISTGSRSFSPVSLNTANNTSARSGLLHCSFLPSSSLSCSSSFSGLSLGLDWSSKSGVGQGKGRSLVVRAGKAALCQTKRNRSRKSLSRTHGFRRRMRTTGGRAILKRRRAKGRRVLCTKSYPNSGKGA